MAKVDEDTVRLRHVDRQGHETSFDVVRRADGRFAPRAQR
jgi:hypothetical protein